LGSGRSLPSVVAMNSNHARVCGSREWAEYLQTDVLPPLAAGIDLGGHMLEIGPGYGAATDWLRHRAGQLTCVEIDKAAATDLTSRFAGTNVRIVAGTGTDLAHQDESFDSVGCFTMLHHVPTRAQQDKIFFEAYRVLRPGGVLICSDSLASCGLHEFHADDTYNPVEPASVLTRLQTIGFDAVTVTVNAELRFTARKPVSEDPRETR
jgi:ubiquinone/menaquinone biosynthesis C-methylase UbiE